MKRLLCAFLSLMILVSVISCAGPQGPKGEQGAKGPAGPPGPGNATVLQVYTEGRFLGQGDRFSTMPRAQRGEEVRVAGAGFQTGEIVKIYVQDQLAATVTVTDTSGAFTMKFMIPLGVIADTDPNLYRLSVVKAIGDGGSLAIAPMMVSR